MPASHLIGTIGAITVRGTVIAIRPGKAVVADTLAIAVFTVLALAKPAIWAKVAVFTKIPFLAFLAISPGKPGPTAVAIKADPGFTALTAVATIIIKADYPAQTAIAGQTGTAGIYSVTRFVNDSCPGPGPGSGIIITTTPR